MGRNRHQPIDLAGISEILRAHATQISPPGMRLLKNLYMSRSDSAITLRHDFQQSVTDMTAVGDEIEGANYPEWLGAIYYAIMAGGYLYFSNIAPFSFENLVRTLLSTTYDEGTITTDGTSSIVNGNSQTEWLQYVWAGCLIRERGDTRWYRITEVKSDRYMLTNPAMHVLSGASYEILRTHPLENGEWPIQTETLGSLLVYNPTNPTYPVDQGRISGPFWTDTGRADLFGVWREYTPEVSLVPTGLSAIAVGQGVSPKYYLNYGGIRLPLYVGGDVGFLATQKAWRAYTFQKKFETIGDLNSVGSTRVITAGAGKGYWKIWGDAGIGVKYMAHQWGNYHQNTLPPGAIEQIQTVHDGKVAGIAMSSFNVVVAFEDGKLLVSSSVSNWWELNNEFSEVTWEPIVTVMDPDCYGTSLEFAFGARGQIYHLGSQALVGSADGDVFGYCYGEMAGGGNAIMLVGGVDSAFSEALIIDSPTATVISSGVTDALHAIFFLHAYNAGSYGRYVALGDGGVSTVSDDGGATWTPNASGINWDVLCAANDVQGRAAIACGTAGRIALSSDGTTWGLIRANHLYVYLNASEQGGASRGSSRLSGGGKKTPNITDIGFDEAKGEFVLSVAQEDEGLMQVLRIPRGLQYKSDTSKINGYFNDAHCDLVGYLPDEDGRKGRDIVWDGTNFIVVGEHIYTSPTGAVWTKRFTPTSGWFFKVAADGAGNLVAVGYQGQMAHSANNGVTWTEKYTQGNNGLMKKATTDLVDVVWDSYRFLAVGGRNVIEVNPTGWAYSAQTFDFYDDLEAIVYCGQVGTHPTHGTQMGFADNIIAFSKGQVLVLQNDPTGTVPAPANPDYSGGWKYWSASAEGSVGTWTPESTGYQKMAVGGHGLIKFCVATSYRSAISVGLNGLTNEVSEVQLYTGGSSYYDPSNKPGTAWQSFSSTRGEDDEDGNKTYTGQPVVDPSVRGMVIFDHTDAYKGRATPIMAMIIGNQLTMSSDGGVTWSRRQSFTFTDPTTGAWTRVNPWAKRETFYGYSLFGRVGVVPMCHNGTDLFILGNIFEPGVGGMRQYLMKLPTSRLETAFYNGLGQNRLIPTTATVATGTSVFPTIEWSTGKATIT